MDIKKKQLLSWVFFIPIWICFLSTFIYYSLHIELPQEPNGVTFFTSDSEDDLKYIICNELNKATESVFLASFGITDPHISKLIESKANEGITVDILYDKKQPLSIKKSAPVNFIPFSGRGLMHKKIMAIDNEHVFLGSTNLTLFSLAIHKNMLVSIQSKDLYKAISNDQRFTSDTFNFFPLPLNNAEALEHFVNLIDNAKTRIYAAIFTFTHPKIANALVAAKNRGIDIKVCMDKSMAKGTCLKTVKKLMSAKIPVTTNISEGLLHHKCALIDNDFVFGSANWTRAAFTKNQEYFLTFENLTQVQIQTLESFFKTLQSSCR